MNAEDINPDLSNPFNKSQGLTLQPPAPPDTPQQTPPQPGLAQDTIDRALEAQGPLLAARTEGQGLDNDLKRQQLIKMQRNRDGSRLRYRSKIGMENAGTQAKGMEKFKQIDMLNNKPDWAKRIGSDEWKAESNARNKADGKRRIAEHQDGSKAVVDAIKARRAQNPIYAGMGINLMLRDARTTFGKPSVATMVAQSAQERPSVVRQTPEPSVRQLAVKRGKTNPLVATR